MTMTFTYTAQVKKQAKNPFAKMTVTTKNRLHNELRKRLLWLVQLSSSDHAPDRQFFKAMITADRELFGRAPEYNNAFNTGMAVLGGAVEKLYAGDLSIKQIRYITPVLDLMANCYPKLWEKIQFEDSAVEDNEETTQFESLFDNE